MVSTTWGLVWSRIRFDWKRHTTALTAVAILMASFLTFNAVALGMHEALGAELADGQFNQVQLSLGGFGFGPPANATPLQDVASWAGVEAAHPRFTKATGIAVARQDANRNDTQFFPRGSDNQSSEATLVGIDAAAEAVLVEHATGPPNASQIFRGRPPTNYTLFQGSWIQGAGDAVATQSLAQAGHGLGTTFAVEGKTYTVVGVIANFQPAMIAVPGIRSAGQFLVGAATQTWGPPGGVFLQLKPDFASIQTVSQRLIALYPAQTGPLQAQTSELERQYFEEARTQQVLTAAARLVGVAGAATLFAMSLFLLIAERKAIGTLSSVGFTRLRLASYMNQKIVYLALLGSLVGGAVGWLVVASIQVPTVSFESTPHVDWPTYGVATLETLASALLGGLVAFVVTIRKDPVEALQAVD